MELDPLPQQTLDVLRQLQHKLAVPSDLTGNWSAQRSAHFWHAGDPLEVKRLVEKMTCALMERDRSDTLQLRYHGSTHSCGDPRETTLVLEAIAGSRKRYGLTVQLGTARKWSSEAAFLQQVERTFAFWCSKLDLRPDTTGSDMPSAKDYAECWQRSIVQEEAMARQVEDPAPIAALQREVLDGLRAGMVFFTAHKEGGTHLKFDGQLFIRADYGEEPNTYATYTHEADMLACLRTFFDWDARRDWYPHHPPEQLVWQYIRSQLRPGRA